VIDAVNSLRAAHGLAPYAVNSILMGTAQGQAEYMASTGAISHTGAGGSTVTQRLLAAGYPLAGDLSLGGFRSENIVGSPGMTAEGAVSSWTGDDLHLHTMLSPDLQEIGAGVAEADGVTYYVIDCARPTGNGVPVAYTPGAESALSGGDDIIVPVAMSTPNPVGDLYHEVQAGQTLWSIAIAYGVKINDIRLLNNLDPTSTVIQRGVKLLVKRVGTATPAPPTSSAALELKTATPPPTTSLPSPTASSSPTPTLVAVSGALTGGAAVAAIAVVALVAAALVAWAGRSRPI
jgi:LysM repeat protein